MREGRDLMEKNLMIADYAGAHPVITLDPSRAKPSSNVPPDDILSKTPIGSLNRLDDLAPLPRSRKSQAIPSI